MKHAELAAMELERFGLCVQGALVTMPGTVSEMLQVMDVMGVTAFAEATSKYSGDLLPLPLSLSVEERKWTELRIAYPMEICPPEWDLIARMYPLGVPQK